MIRDATTPNCIVCGKSTVEEFLDLGHTALANKFLLESDLESTEARYPLCVGFCHTCCHVQLTSRVPPEAMFTDYLYISSASDTLRAHFEELSGILVERHGLGREDLVIDIGCNDASLLSAFQRRYVRTLGVDPAENLAELSAGSGVERYTGFFDSRSAVEISSRWGRASLITATNTFPHIPALHDFMRGIDSALAPGGALVIEAHYLVDLLEQLAFDTVYHEHVSYWSLHAMEHLFRSCGMEVIDAERLPLHHGQLRVTVVRKGDQKPAAAVQELLELEKARGLDRVETYHAFADAIQQLKQDVVATLKDLRRQGKRIAGYGAPAKGSTLLEFMEIGPDLLAYIADRSPLKQGRYMPGSHIAIVPPERLIEDRPDYVLLLAWNFADEILAQQQEYRSLGGRFIVPVPEVRVI